MVAVLLFLLFSFAFLAVLLFCFAFVVVSLLFLLLFCFLSKLCNNNNIISTFLCRQNAPVEVRVDCWQSTGINL